MLPVEINASLLLYIFVILLCEINSQNCHNAEFTSFQQNSILQRRKIWYLIFFTVDNRKRAFFKEPGLDS